MSSATNYLENKLIDFLLRGQAFVPPANLYLALFTAAPSDAGGGTEVSGTGYARVAIPCALATWSGTQGQGTIVASSGTGGTSYNNQAVTFGEPGGAWGTVTHFAIMDADTSGNMWYWNSLASEKTITAGNGAVVFLPNELSLQIDN